MSEPWTDLHAVLVTGSRDWTDPELIRERLRHYPAGTILIHGDCGEHSRTTGRVIRGADLLAAEVGEEDFGHIPLPMPPNYRVEARDAPKLRNKLMVEVLTRLRWCGYKVAAEAFPLPSSRGTWHTVRLVEAVGIKLTVTKPTEA